MLLLLTDVVFIVPPGLMVPGLLVPLLEDIKKELIGEQEQHHPCGAMIHNLPSSGIVEIPEVCR
jgi:hypothetical protein